MPQAPSMQTDKHAIEDETAFVIRERREGYPSTPSSRQRRRSFFDRLDYQFHKDLDSRFVGHGTRPWPNTIEKCYILADEPACDGKFVTVAKAANAISLAQFGVVLSFTPEELGCYRSESTSKVVWLERKWVAQ